MANFHGAHIGRENRKREHGGDLREDFLRLGRRSVMGRNAKRDAARDRHSRSAERRGPRHTHSRERRGACERGRVRATHAGPRRAHAPDQGKLRSERHPQSRPHVRGRVNMQTNFTLAQLADPNIAVADKILRACVHCGFCTATCPTYVLLGDELDSPRGRIYLIKEMLEKNEPATADVVKHIDRCLSCLACMTTCPSGVHYMHLVDQARTRIEETYRRPLLDRLYRAFLAKLMPYPARFRAALYAALLAKPFAPLFAAIGLKPIAAMLRLAPWRVPASSLKDKQRIFPAEGKRRGRVALLSGCVDRVAQPAIRAAAIRLLNRQGIEVVLASGEGCCGSLRHPTCRRDQPRAFARNQG